MAAGMGNDNVETLRAELEQYRERVRLIEALEKVLPKLKVEVEALCALERVVRKSTYRYKELTNALAMVDAVREGIRKSE